MRNPGWSSAVPTDGQAGWWWYRYSPDHEPEVMKVYDSKDGPVLINEQGYPSPLPQSGEWSPCLPPPDAGAEEPANVDALHRACTGVRSAWDALDSALSTYFAEFGEEHAVDCPVDEPEGSGAAEDCTCEHIQPLRRATPAMLRAITELGDALRVSSPPPPRAPEPSAKPVPCNHTTSRHSWTSEECPLCDDSGMRHVGAVERYEEDSNG